MEGSMALMRGIFNTEHTPDGYLPQNRRHVLEVAIDQAISLLDEMDDEVEDLEDDDPGGTDLDVGEHDEADNETDGLEHGEGVEYVERRAA